MLLSRLSYHLRAQGQGQLLCGMNNLPPLRPVKTWMGAVLDRRVHHSAGRSRTPRAHPKILLTFFAFQIALDNISLQKKKRACVPRGSCCRSSVEAYLWA